MLGCKPKKVPADVSWINTHRRLRLNIEGNKVSAIDCVKLLGVEVDNKLNFDKHVETLCSKTNIKIKAFSELYMHTFPENRHY